MLELFNVRGPNITTVKSHLQVGQNWGGLYFVVSCIKTIYIENGNPPGSSAAECGKREREK